MVLKIDDACAEASVGGRIGQDLEDLNLEIRKLGKYGRRDFSPMRLIHRFHGFAQIGITMKAMKAEEIGAICG
jgi:hypothetical protein